MNDKRQLYVQARVTQQEMAIIDAVARRLRRTRSDTLRFLALERAEMMGLITEGSELETVHQAMPKETSWAIAHHEE